MKISIVICNFNQSQYFKDAFDSLLNQTFQDFEAIIIDDSSTDDSTDVISGLIKDDKRFTLYHNDKNYGYAYTLDRGIRMAKSELVCRLDPDDSLRNDSLEKVLEKFQESENIIATYSKIMICDSDLKPLQNFKNSYQVPNSSIDFFNVNHVINHFFVFKKEIYLKTSGINTFMKRAIDQDLYLKLYEHGDIIFIPEDFYNYRKHENGISQFDNKYKAKLWQAFAIYEAAKRRELDNGELENIILNNVLGLNSQRTGFQNTLLYRCAFKLYKLFKK